MRCECFSPLGVILMKVILALSENVKYLGGKSTNELLHSLLNFEFINPYHMKYILVIHRVQIPWDSFIMVCSFNVQK